ncbi:MAG: signal recognition particle protein [Catonella sp.]|jgi:signal recognition particle subunit SRP54|nr:signal recognition particle protein [Catonella sp.]MDY6355968.1 signal recognition particle protein [Catonella sp.]
MAFDSLTGRLQQVFKNLRGKGKLTEADVKAALKEVKIALLEADVNFKVVKDFIKSVEERAVGEEVMKSLTPGQMVVKIVNEEMVKLLGSEKKELTILPSNEITIVMMCGLQGAGKTTTTAKLAKKLAVGKVKPLLVACDIYRPAAIKQLQVNGEKVGIPVFSMGDGYKPADIAKAAVAHAKENGENLLFLDTAGRLQIDEDMMDELVEIKNTVSVTQTLLVVDAMTGQEAVNVAKTFDEKIGLDGVILTKLDGDTRGGAALSIRAVTGKPIIYAGMGEKLTDLEEFYPDRMANRILGMGDILTLIDKAQSTMDMEKSKELEKRIKKAEFDYNDMLDQFEQVSKLGGVKSILGMMPTQFTSRIGDNDVDESQMDRVKAIIYSMTKEERANPALINMSRKSRIAKGAGVPIAEVNRLTKQMDQMKKLMKQMGGMMKGKKRGGFGNNKFRLPF